MPYQPYQSTWTNPYMPQVQQPQFSPVVPSVTSTYSQPVNGVIKVNGRDSALQYQLPPNSMSPALFDNNGKVFYIISTDGTGTKSVEVFDFTPHVEQPAVPKGCCYTVAVENVDAGVGGTLVDQQTISVADGNLVVARIA